MAHGGEFHHLSAAGVPNKMRRICIMDVNRREAVDGVNKLEEALLRVRAAQKKFSAYTEEQVDNIFKAAAIAANQARLPLAKLAVEETGMGVVEDKVIKNNYAAEHIYNAYIPLSRF